MIGLFNECFPPIMDGVAVTVSNLARHFYQRGAEVSVVTPQIPGLDATKYPYSLYQYLSFPVPGRYPYRSGVPQLDYKFQRQMDALDFSILHAHCPFSSGDVALKMSKRRGIPLVATFHSKYRDDFKRVIPNKQVVDYLVSRVVKFYESVDEVWVPQASVGETLRSYGYRGKFEVVDNGTEFADVHVTDSDKLSAKKELFLREDEPLLLFVGQHIWEKNVRLILEALASIKDMPYHALFVGEGYAKEDMLALAENLGLSGHKDYRMDKVTFFGSVKSRELMKTIYTASDLFLFPSLYDNAPLVVREAASLGTPSLVTRGSNTAEVIRDGFNGFLADNDVSAFAMRLRYILERPVTITWAASGAAQTLVRPWDDIAAEVLDRYRHLIARKENRLAI